MSKFAVFIFVLIGCARAEALLRVKECLYDIHAVKFSGIRHDSYYENPLEMRKIAPGTFRGVQNFSPGTLIIDAKLDGGRIVIDSRMTIGQTAAAAARGWAAINSNSKYLRVFRLHKQTRPNEDSNETQIINFEIKCLVGDETISDKIFDSLE